MNKFYRYLFGKFRVQLLQDKDFLNDLQAALSKRKIERCTKQVVMGKGTCFYEQSEVNNIRNRPELIQIGCDSHIRGELTLFGHGGEIIIGNNVYIGDGTRIWSADKVTIGNDVLISHNVNVIDTDSHELDYELRAKTYQEMVKKGHAKENKNIISKPIVIGDNVWLSFNVTVLKGVTIGSRSIVGAGSVVLEDVPADSFAAGVPAKVIRSLAKKSD